MRFYPSAVSSCPFTVGTCHVPTIVRTSPASSLSCSERRPAASAKSASSAVVASLLGGPPRGVQARKQLMQTLMRSNSVSLATAVPQLSHQHSQSQSVASSASGVNGATAAATAAAWVEDAPSSHHSLHANLAESKARDDAEEQQRLLAAAAALHESDIDEDEDEDEEEEEEGSNAEAEEEDEGANPLIDAEARDSDDAEDEDDEDDEGEDDEEDEEVAAIYNDEEEEIIDGSEYEDDDDEDEEGEVEDAAPKTAVQLVDANIAAFFQTGPRAAAVRAPSLLNRVSSVAAEPNADGIAASAAQTLGDDESDEDDAEDAEGGADAAAAAAAAGDATGAPKAADGKAEMRCVVWWPVGTAYV